MRSVVLIFVALAAIPGASAWNTAGPLLVGDEQRVSFFTPSVEWFDDFLGDALNARYTPLEGTDTATADQAIVAGAQHGVLRITSGDTDGVYATDGAEVVLGRHWTGAGAGTSAHQQLVFEAKAKINTAVTNCSVFIGFTDIVTLEEPASLATVTITSNATDAVGFLYDTAATTDEWIAFGVATDVDASTYATGSTGVIPVLDVYQTFRIVITNGGGAEFYINGAKVKTLDAAVTPSVLITPVLSINATTTTSKVLDVDYLYVASNRE